MKARALLFGLNYPHIPGSSLNGCINDVKNMSDFLSTTMNIPCSVFTDEKDPAQTSARSIIQNIYTLALQSYSEQLDLVYIHYSGHGSYMLDKSGDEKDGQDECLVPSDYQTSGMITDDLINNVLIHINPKTRVICVFDCCHSGTIADVKYSWEAANKCGVENVLCPIRAKVITLSGCLDNQTSADAYNIQGDNKYTGALTTCLLTVLKNNQTAKSDVFTLLIALRAELKNRSFSQVPKLCSSHNLARDRVFIP
jgi:hypothetical protein